MVVLTETDVVWRIHRDIYPDTDYGYTWVECYWFEHDGEHVSPICPSAGCCERTGNLPGGPLGCNESTRRDFGQYAPNGHRIVKSEETHCGRHKVGTVCIVKQST